MVRQGFAFRSFLSFVRSFLTFVGCSSALKQSVPESVDLI